MAPVYSDAEDIRIERSYSWGSLYLTVILNSKDREPTPQMKKARFLLPLKRAIGTLALSTFVAITAVADDKTASLILTGGDVHTYEKEGVMHLAAQRKSPVLSLGAGPTFDVREVVAASGVVLGPTDVALYSAKSQLMYVRTSPDNVEMIRTLFKPLVPVDYSLAAYDIEILVRTAAGPAEPLSAVAEFHFTTVSGQTAQVAIKHQGEERRLSFEMVALADGQSFEVSLSGKLPIPEQDVALSLSSSGELGKLVTAFERSGNSFGGTKLQVQVRATPRLTEQQKEHTAEMLELKLKNVEEELRRAPSGE